MLRGCRATVPGADAASQLPPATIQSDRDVSPILRCVAAIGSQPLSDADLSVIRVLVERMAIFASYQGCIPGGLAAVEATEDAQKMAWDELMSCHDQRGRQHAVLDAEQSRVPARRICVTSQHTLACEIGQAHSTDTPDDDVATVEAYSIKSICGVFSAAVRNQAGLRPAIHSTTCAYSTWPDRLKMRQMLSASPESCRCNKPRQRWPTATTQPSRR